MDQYLKVVVLKTGRIVRDADITKQPGVSSLLQD